MTKYYSIESAGFDRRFRLRCFFNYSELFKLSKNKPHKVGTNKTPIIPINDLPCSSRSGRNRLRTKKKNTHYEKSIKHLASLRRVLKDRFKQSQSSTVPTFIETIGYIFHREIASATSTQKKKLPYYSLVNAYYHVINNYLKCYLIRVRTQITRTVLYAILAYKYVNLVCIH